MYGGRARLEAFLERRVTQYMRRLNVERRGIGNFGRTSQSHRSLPLGPERLEGSPRVRSVAMSLES